MKLIDVWNPLTFLRHCFCWQTVEPTGKRFILAIDASTTMTHGGVNGSPQVTPLETAAAMAMVTLRTEQKQNCRMVTFSQTVHELSLTREMSVKDIHDNMLEKVYMPCIFFTVEPTATVNLKGQPSLINGHHDFFYYRYYF